MQNMDVDLYLIIPIVTARKQVQTNVIREQKAKRFLVSINTIPCFKARSIFRIFLANLFLNHFTLISQQIYY